MTIIRGPAWQRWLVATSCWLLAAFFIALLSSDLLRGSSSVKGWVLTELAFGTLAASLGVRAAVSRTETDSHGLTLHGLFRTRVIGWSDVASIFEARYLGRPANYVALRSGHQVLLPLLTQVGVPADLKTMRDILEAKMPSPMVSPPP